MGYSSPLSGERCLAIILLLTFLTSCASQPNTLLLNQPNGLNEQPVAPQGEQVVQGKKLNLGSELGNKNLDNGIKTLDRKPNDTPKKTSGVDFKYRQAAIKLVETEACAADIKAICSEDKRRNNFAVLACLQSQRKSDVGLSGDCQHLVWNYKKNLTTDRRFEPAASQVCSTAFLEIPECEKLTVNSGLRISCLIEKKANITSAACLQFLSKMGSVIFSDFRLMNNFIYKCASDIDSLSCGRMDSSSEVRSSQGATIECLEKKIDSLNDECKLQILRVAELQSEDFHLNRPLYYACRDDRESFCKETKSGGGAVLQCLIKHKFEKTMTEECMAKLTEVQKLMEQDVNINRPLMLACKKEIRAKKCLRKKKDDEFKAKTTESRQSRVILCLEDYIESEPDSISGYCRSALRDTRKALMQDYKLSPDIVLYCQDDIENKCSHGMVRGGKTLHCLMNLVRKGKNSNDMCKKALNDLLEEVKPAEDVALDPTLSKACGTMITKCQENARTKSDMLSCLLDRIQDDAMPEECERRVLELQFFVSRNIKLDQKLYQACRRDVDDFCSWGATEDSEHHSSELFSCLYKQYQLQSEDDSQIQVRLKNVLRLVQPTARLRSI